MRTKFLVLSLFSLQLMSCATAVEYLPYVYKIDVNQGNVIDQTMIDQLRPNMTKRQVLYIMGSPMLVDFFHQNRWDYVYSSKKGGEDLEQKTVSIFFENEQLKNIQGDFRPSALPVSKPSSELVVDVPKRDVDQTLWGTFTGWLNYGGEKKDVEPLKQQSATQ
ncbi:MAG: outer membrane protein assembly factor BamE [Methylococcales bacterium]|nr:outer membrane protein assembly factor BamE [Methylococcales bacterium]